jgi:K+-sensing histidine kinase KdpD
MRDDADRFFYMGAGPIAAIVLGGLLVPARGFTSASNFTFLFLALTIVAAEYGGRGAALATAVASALSLDFFLTQPYLHLEIADKHDLIATLGMAGCGLLVASFASSRGRER